MVNDLIHRTYIMKPPENPKRTEFKGLPGRQTEIHTHSRKLVPLKSTGKEVPVFGIFPDLVLCIFSSDCSLTKILYNKLVNMFS